MVDTEKDDTSRNYLISVFDFFGKKYRLLDPLDTSHWIYEGEEIEEAVDALVDYHKKNYPKCWNVYVFSNNIYDIISGDITMGEVIINRGLDSDERKEFGSVEILQ